MTISDTFLFLIGQIPYATLLFILLAGSSFLLVSIDRIRHLALLWALYFPLSLLPLAEILSYFFPKSAKEFVTPILAIPVQGLSQKGGGVEKATQNLLSFESLALIWLIGCIVAFLWMVFVPIWRQYFLELRLNQSMERKTEFFSGDLNTKIHLFNTSDIESPFVSGFFRQKIYFPMKLLQYLSRSQLADVIRHEEAHLQNRDTLVLLQARLVSCLFWFFPLMYLANLVLKLAQEFVADHNVLHNKGKAQKMAYAETMASVALLQQKKSYAPMAPGFLGKKHLIWRLRMLKKCNFSAKQSWVLPALLLILSSAVAYGTLGNAAAEKGYIYADIEISREGQVVAHPTIAAAEGEKATVVVGSDGDYYRMSLVFESISDQEIKIQAYFCNKDNSEDIMEQKCEDEKSWEAITNIGETVSFSIEGVSYDMSIVKTPELRPYLFEKVKISVENVEPIELVKELSKQTGVNFILANIEMKEKVSLDFHGPLIIPLTMLSRTQGIQWKAMPNDFIKIYRP